MVIKIQKYTFPTSDSKQKFLFTFIIVFSIFKLTTAYPNMGRLSVNSSKASVPTVMVIKIQTYFPYIWHHLLLLLYFIFLNSYMGHLSINSSSASVCSTQRNGN